MQQICIMAGLKDIAHADPARTSQLALEWGQKQAISSLALQLAKLGLKDRAVLINSLKAKIRKKFGEIDSVRIEFEWYGLFHNYGAENAFGKGVDLPATFWIAMGVNPVIQDLADKVGDYYAEVAIKNIEIGKS